MLSEHEFNRTYWASRRGMLELDLVLLPFVEKRLRELSDAQQQEYIELLKSEDTELFAWFLQRERPTDSRLTGIVDEILAFTHRAQR
ncbi:MAG: hypothetical protein JWM78_1181 [Verrucomicrobiaceae bacterium]|nr:hypothetical protein [Verrucomicrobiaceae bacterium]